MKKLIVLQVVLMMVASLGFAQVEESFGAQASELNDDETTQVSNLPKIERFDLEIHLGNPIHWTSAVHDQEFYWFYPDYNMEDYSLTSNTAFGISTIFNFGRKAGFSLDADFFYGAKIAGFANPSSDYISMFGANVLLGPIFYLYSNAWLRIPLTVGGHMYYFVDDLWMPNLAGSQPGTPPPVNTDGFWMNRSEFQVGPGVSLGVQFHFSKNLYIFSRTDVAVDIFRWHQIKYIADDGTGALTDVTKSETEFVVSWEVKPVLGIGIKF
jgi:hypothetical protein